MIRIDRLNTRHAHVAHLQHSADILASTRSRWNRGTLWRFRNPLESVDHWALQRASWDRESPIPQTFLIKSNSNLIAHWLLFASLNRGPIDKPSIPSRVPYRSCRDIENRLPQRNKRLNITYFFSPLLLLLLLLLFLPIDRPELINRPIFPSLFYRDQNLILI